MGGSATARLETDVGNSLRLPTTRMKSQRREVAKQNFLHSMSSNGKYKYKRYNGLPLRYAGGKSLAVGHVVEAIPSKVIKLVSPFFGGGAVEFAASLELGMKVVGYDVFGILTDYWEEQLNRPAELARRIRKWKPTRDEYNRVKERLKGHWTGKRPIKDRLDLAAQYWFNHNLSYGPGFLGWMSRIYEDPVRFDRLVSKVQNFSAPRVKVRQGTFERTIPKHCKDFLYCDPPYFLDGDSKMFRGIYPQRNFPVYHKGFDHELLRVLLGKHKGGFILSYNDCDQVRKWYGDFRIVKVEWQYTLGQGETRIGKNRVEKGSDHVKESHELLIVKEPCP